MKTLRGNTIMYIAIVVALAVLVSVIGWMYVKKIQAPASQGVSNQPTPSPTKSVAQPGDETANWKRYQNEKYGFEFWYPTEYRLEQPASDVVIVRVPKKEEYLQIQSWTTELPDENYSPEGAKMVGEVFIGKLGAKKYYTENPLVLEGTIKGQPFTDYVVSLPSITSKWLDIRYYGKGDVADLFEKIISTLKPTE